MEFWEEAACQALIPLIQCGLLATVLAETKKAAKSLQF